MLKTSILLSVWCALALAPLKVRAQTAEHETVWDTHNQRWLTPTQLADLAQSGDIFVLGENHATIQNQNDPETHIHHDNQVRFIEALQAEARELTGTTVSVGMEFLTYTDQSFVDQFLASSLPEDQFLKDVNWSSNPFEFYRRQILAPRLSGGQTIALNIPETIARAVALKGPTSLSQDQRRLLPPVWERGNALYFERFQQAMQGHASQDQIADFFWAQSLWDDTMAWRASLYRQAHPHDIMVVIIGAFHVEFGGGFPFELKRYTRFPVRTVLQIQAPNWEAKTLHDLVQPDARYGQAADYLWLHSGVKPSPPASNFSLPL